MPLSTELLSLMKGDKMRKCEHLIIKKKADSNSDIEYSGEASDFLSEKYDDNNEDGPFTGPIDQFLQILSIQDFASSKVLRMNIGDDELGVKVKECHDHINTNQGQVLTDSIYALCSHLENFSNQDFDKNNNRICLYFWKNMHHMNFSDFSSFVHTYLFEGYKKMRKNVRFLLHLSPSIENFNSISTIRRDCPRGRILFHYIGYGFPQIDNGHVYVFDKKNNAFSKYDIRNIFDSIKPPMCFVFDSSNAASYLNLLNIYSKEKIKIDGRGSHMIDWSDYYCFCSSDYNELLPTDPRLPRDFLTSCLLSPVRTAIICHIIQYFQTTLVNEQFPINELEGPLLQEINPNTNSTNQLHESLLKVLNSIVEAIASDYLNTGLFRKIFRTDSLISSHFRYFILAQYLLRPYQVHPMSYPQIPDLSQHPLWQHWKVTLDMILIPPIINNHIIADDMFIRAKDSFSGFLSRKEYEFIPTSLLMMMIHSPEWNMLQFGIVKLLTQFASTSNNARLMITKCICFPRFFELIFLPELPESDFRGIIYVLLSVLHNIEIFVNDIVEDILVSKLLEFLSSPDFKSETKTLIAALIATLIPYNDGLKNCFMNEGVFSTIMIILKTSDSSLSLWCLVMLTRVITSTAFDYPLLYKSGLHIQVASFCLHNSYEIRSASINLLSLFLQKSQDLANIHMFGFAMIGGFDGSFLVRYYSVRFLASFFEIYFEKYIKKVAISIMSHQAFGSLINKWTSTDISYRNITSEFKSMVLVIQSLCRSTDLLSKPISITLFLVELLSNDPHPLVKEYAKRLLNNMNEYSQSNRIPHDYTQQSAPKHIDHSGFEIGSVTVSSVLHSRSQNKKSETNLPRPNIIETIPDPSFIIFSNQLINSNIWNATPPENPGSSIMSLPQAPIEYIPSTQILPKSRFSKDKDSVNNISYDAKSLCIAASYSSGVLVFEENTRKTKSTIVLHSRTTSLNVVSWGNEPLVIAGTEDGCAYVWDPSKKNPNMIFRCDSTPKIGNTPQIIAPYLNKPFIVTSRGTNGAFRLWDIEGQRVVGEWEIDSSSPVSALAINPIEPNILIAGYTNGRFVSLDIRADNLKTIQDINSTQKSNKIMKIIWNYSNSMFYAADEKGYLSKWSSLEDIKTPFSTGAELFCFDAHPNFPLFVFSMKDGHPIIVNNDADVLHELSDVPSCSACCFHPSLPIVGFGTPNGEVIEFEMKSQ